MFWELSQPDSLRSEAEYARLGDRRLNERYGTLLEAIVQNPSEHFPQIARDEAELEAMYRFFRNDRVDFESVAEPHLEATAKRIRQTQETPVVAIHDTTHFVVSDDRYVSGMGRGTSNSNCGFFGHFCLGVRAEGPRHPFGFLGGLLWRRGLPTNMDTESEPSEGSLERLENESDKWDRVLESVEERLETPEKLVHVLDAGADKYSRIVELTESSSQFVFRIKQNRRIVESIEGVESPKIFDALRRAPKIGTRAISIARRDNKEAPPGVQADHPSREARETNVEIRATKAHVRSPDRESSGQPESVEVGLIWVRELEPPEDEEPIDWKLMTNCASVENSEEVFERIDHYQRRWVIEESFGVLKGGCIAEDRLLRSAQTYTTALAVLLPVAWRLLLLRSQAQNAPEKPAETVLRDSQIQTLSLFDKTDFDDPGDATVADVYEAIAALGGHCRCNGPPGWKVLLTGWSRLTLAELIHFKTHEQLINQIRTQWESSSPEEFGQWLNEADASLPDL